MDEHMLIAAPAAAIQANPSASFECHLIIDRKLEAPPLRASRARAHLAPWQTKLACDLMLAQMSTGLALADVAGRLHMSVSHFIKAFRETEGVAPYHWYMQRRIAQAMTLLLDRAIPLTKVADECGFADQSHFTKAFTRMTGVSPGRWRRARGAPPSLEG